MKSLGIIFLLVFAFYFSSITQSLAENTQVGNVISNLPYPTDTSKIMGVSRVNISTVNSKVGDNFCAKLVENLTVNNQLIVPCGSVVSGQVTKVIKPARINIFRKDGQLVVTINQIQTPDGSTICLTGREIRGVVVSPYSKSFGRRLGERVPMSAAGSGTSIPLHEATNLNGGIVYAISVGASAVTGFVSGAMAPDVGETRLESAFIRAFEGTPLGNVMTFFSKGREAVLNTGQGIVLNFDNQTIAKIQEQYCLAQSRQIPVTTTTSGQNIVPASGK